jgi:hypothetical protein
VPAIAACVVAAPAPASSSSSRKGSRDNDFFSFLEDFLSLHFTFFFLLAPVGSPRAALSKFLTPPLHSLMASTAMRSTMRASTSSRAAAPPAARRLSLARTSGLTSARRPSVLSQAQAAEELGFKEMRKGVKVRSVDGVLCAFGSGRHGRGKRCGSQGKAIPKGVGGVDVFSFATASAVALSPRHVECGIPEPYPFPFVVLGARSASDRSLHGRGTTHSMLPCEIEQQLRLDRPLLRLLLFLSSKKKKNENEKKMTIG